VPCKIFFKYKSEGEMNVYASLKEKEPYENDFEYHKEGRPSCLIIGSGQLSAVNRAIIPEIFQKKFIYITLESKICLNLDVVVTFGNPVDRSHVVKRGVERKNSDEISESMKRLCKMVYG